MSTGWWGAHVGEVLLQPLVGIVDAELLEGVDSKDLEAEDVEHADLQGAHGRLLLVDAHDEPVKERGVERLGERLLEARSLCHRERADGHIADGRAHDEPVLELGGADAEHRRRERQRAVHVAQLGDAAGVAQ